MNKILKYGLLLLATAHLFTSCSDDRDDNPTLRPATEFVLNTPSYASQTLDMSHSKGIALSWSQPNYGFPLVVSYQLEVSLNGKFEISVEQADADKSGQTKADYALIDQVFTKCQSTVPVNDLNVAFQQLGKWQENAVPQTQEVQMRLMSYVNGAGGSYDTLYSNPISLNIAPVYVELRPADPELWYIIGSFIGKEHWQNDASKVGESLQPFYVKAGAEYDKKTGKGIIQYVGYFPKGKEFKVLKNIGDWDHFVFCKGDSYEKPFLRNGDNDPGNISVPESGYYEITIDTRPATPVWSMKPYTPATPISIFEKIVMPGKYNGWNNDSTPFFKLNPDEVTKNHDWWKQVTFTENAIGKDDGVKFTNGTWDINWGAAEFPYGVGVHGGTNIPTEIGKYKVFFNDITGAYSFIKQE